MQSATQINPKAVEQKRKYKSQKEAVVLPSNTIANPAQDEKTASLGTTVHRTMDNDDQNILRNYRKFYNGSHEEDGIDYRCLFSMQAEKLSSLEGE